MSKSSIFHGQRVDRTGCVEFNDSILAELQTMALTGMTRAEILEGYSLDESQLNDADLRAFNEHYAYGRALGLKRMGESLFSQAQSRQGTAAALAFLARFSTEWKKEVDTLTGDTNFNFNMKI